MSFQLSLLNLPSVIFLPESESGHMLSDKQDGQTIALYGQVPAHASLSARQAKEAGLLTSATSGQTSIGSSSSVALTLSLANKLQAETVSRGSTLYRLTWRHVDMPSGRRIYALRASAHRTSGSDFFGWPTPVASEYRDCARPIVLAKADRGGRLARWISARCLSIHSIQQSITVNPAFSRWLMGLPRVWDDCAGMAMQSLHQSRKRL